MKNLFMPNWRMAAFCLAFLVDASLPSGQAALQKAEVEVETYQMMAADFARSKREISSDPTMHGSRVLRGSKRLILLDLPAPASSKDLYVYVKARVESADDRLMIGTSRNGERIDLGSLKGGRVGEWSWVCFEAIPGVRVGESLRIDAVPSPKEGRSIALDRIVISTKPSLTDEALEQVPLLLSERPFVKVNLTQEPPSLNGKGDDPVWDQAVAIKDFLTFSTGVPAGLKTTVRFLYDNQNLYAQFVVDEPFLRAAEMRMEELVTRATEHDQMRPHSVLSDDACLLMIQPGKGASIYEWVANTLGTLLDARMSEEDLWITRDVAWSPEEVRSTVSRQEGRWIWEMSIPFKELGARPPKAGENWRVAIARLSPSRKEFSAWNPTWEAAHKPKEWGILRFASAESAISMNPEAPLSELSPGVNHLKLNATAATGTAQRTFTSLTPEGGLHQLAHMGSSADTETRQVSHRFDVSKTIMTRAQWGFFDAHSMSPIYIAPPSQIAVRSTALKLTLSTPGAYEVMVNDSIVASGSSANEETLELAMRHGANLLAIRAQAGVTQIELRQAGGRMLPEAWRVKEVNDPKALTSQLDDRDWPLLTPSESDLPQGKPLVFRRLVLSSHTRVWPEPSPALFVAHGSSQPASFKFNGLPGRDLAGWTTWVAMPETLVATAVSGFYGTAAKQPVFKLERDGVAEIDGETLARYKITADKPLYYDRRHLPGGRRGLFHLMLKVAEGVAPDRQLAERVYYWSDAEQGGVYETPQSFMVQTMPPLEGRQPKQFVLELWGSNLGTLDNVSVREQALDTMRQAGFNLIVDHREWTVRNGERYGVTVRPMVNFSAWSINLAPYLESHPTEQLLTREGERKKQWICTTLLLGEKWPQVAEIFADHLRRLGAKTVCYDHEFSTMSGPHSCFCERCLGQFRKEKAIAPEPVLTPDLIETRYRAEWDDFMARRSARLLAKMRGTVHATIPGGQFAVFSLPQSPRTVSVYGTDWRYVAEEKGADIVQVGTSGTWEQITQTSKAIGEIPVMYGVWMTPYDANHMAPARVASKAELLRRALDSTRGILLYDRAVMDGRSWSNVAWLSRLVSEFEEMFLTLRPTALKGHAAESVQWLQGETQQLLLLMNHQNKEVSYTVELPPDAGNGYEFQSKVETDESLSINVTLPPGEAVVYVFQTP